MREQNSLIFSPGTVTGQAEERIKIQNPAFAEKITFYRSLPVQPGDSSWDIYLGGNSKTYPIK